MVKTSKPPKPQNLPAKAQLYRLPTDGNVLKFAGLTKGSLLSFDYVESKTKTQPLTMSEAQLAELLRKGIFVKL
jgi:hypothetical protein